MKLLIVSLIVCLTMSITGCYVTNLQYFVIPDDQNFIETVESLDTLQKISDYMKENFTPMAIHILAYTPYQMFNLQKGDCNDYSAFSAFVANWHGIESYQMLICWEDFAHMWSIFKIDNYYRVMDWNYLHPYIYKDFDEILNLCTDWTSYKVYDYNMNIIEEGGR